MGQIVVGLSVSLDGYFAGPAGELDWHRVDEELHQHFNDTSRAMSWFLDGRVMWELMAGYWPTADEDPTASPPEIEFAGIWRDMPKIVFSRTLTEAGWNTTIRRQVDPDEIRALAAEADGDLSVGGADLIASFVAHDLIDEWRIYVVPVVIGAGKPLWAPDTRLDLRLVEHRAFGNDVVLLRYRRADG
jgi:dihydrofolate reductase